LRFCQARSIQAGNACDSVLVFQYSREELAKVKSALLEAEQDKARLKARLEEMASQPQSPQRSQEAARLVREELEQELEAARHALQLAEEEVARARGDAKERGRAEADRKREADVARVPAPAVQQRTQGEDEQGVSAPIEKASFSWLCQHVKRCVTACTLEMQEMERELVFLSQQYEKTGVALVSVEIALDDALSREAESALIEASHALRHAQTDAQVSQLTTQVAQLKACLAQSTAETENTLRDAEELARRYIQAQQHLLQLHAALHPSLDQDLGGVGLSLMTVEPRSHQLLSSPEAAVGAVGRRIRAGLAPPAHVRIENVAPHSSAAAAAKAGLLLEGAMVHKIDMMPVEDVDIKELRKRLLGATGSLVSLHVSLPVEGGADAMGMPTQPPRREALRLVVLQRELPSKVGGGGLSKEQKELPVRSGLGCIGGHGGVVDEMCRDIKSVQMQLARVKQREVALQAHSQRLLVELEEAQAVAARASQDAVKASEDIAAQCARAAQLAAQVGVLEQDDLAGKNLLSRVSHQYEAEKKDREAAQARLDHQQVARAQAEARLEEECERMRSLEVVLEAHKQQRDSDAAALQGLELLLVEQKEQLKRLQEEREHLMSSQSTRFQKSSLSLFYVGSMLGL